MFSSKFLSGANPLNAMSSAVNKFGLFGDDGEGDKKSPSQQGRKPSGEPQPGQGPGKDTQQEQAPKKPSQGPPMQKSQPYPKQGTPQQRGNGQTAPPPNKPAGQQAKGPPQQGSPKPGVQQQVPTKNGAQPVSPKQVPPKMTVQLDSAKSGVQKQELVKTGVQGPSKAGSDLASQQQSSQNTKQDSPKVGQQQQGGRKQISGRQQDIKGRGTPEVTPVGSPLLGASKAGPQAKSVSKPVCSVCNTTELNIHTKETPNYKTCTRCKTEVCCLCGFSPPDADGREWLCLTCQIQRAQGTSETPGPSIKKSSPNTTPAPQNRRPSPGEPIKKDISAPGSPQKVQSKPIKVPVKDEPPKGLENPKQISIDQAQRMTPETQRAAGSPKQRQSGQPGQSQSPVTPALQQASGGLFGFSGGAKSESAKPDESVTGKMFGFGSSLFSSASTLIGSAVQEDNKTTPPVSPKMQSAKDTKVAPSQKLELEKKQQKPQEGRTQSAGQKAEKSSAETPKAATASLHPPNKGQSTCPICKIVLNFDSKDPPNYNSCTECKSTVCNQCGFNPMPNVKEEKEWLCLNCQMKRAAEGIKPQKEVSLGDSFKKTATQPAPQKTSAPSSPQKKRSTAEVQQGKIEGPQSHKETGQAPGQKTPQQSQGTDPQKQTSQTIRPPQKTGNATTQESGGFFGFGGPKNQSDAAKPTESVTGKMFGFGTSIFSSASTLITSTVQDDPKFTPPVSPKKSPAKDLRSPTVKQQEQDKKPQQLQQATGSTPMQPKVDKPISELPKKGSSSPVISKTSDSNCPLCKVKLNLGSKDPPNYSTCTECKNIVCNQCGFNPTPNVKEMKEWLCLNCQVQRALGASEPPGTPVMKLRASPNKTNASADSLKKETPSQQKEIPAVVKSKETSPLVPAQQKSQKPVEQSAKVEKIPECQKHVTPEAGQKSLEQDHKTGHNKPSDQMSQTEHKKSGISSTKEEDGKSLKSGGPKPQPDVTKPAESLGGKMFGFGSSMLSSASNIITSAVQDESKTTPPVSPKIPVAKGTKSIPLQKHDQEKKLQQDQQTKHSPLLQAKVEKGPPGHVKDAVASDGQKAGQCACPLCKTELNIDSKDPPNYNKCTECKTTVCNQCGFSPVLNVSEVKEWLCLNCQMQRALSAAEVTGPSVKPEIETRKSSPFTASQKIQHPKQEESLNKELPDKTVEPLMSSQKKGSSTPGSPQRTQRAALPPCAKGQEAKTQPSPSTGQTPPNAQMVTSTQKQTDQASKLDPKHSKVKPEIQQESEKTTGSIDLKKVSGASKTTDTLGGKMFGFGSSIFSSASNLISAAVQEESRTMPGGSRKMSAPPQMSGKMSVSPSISPKNTPSVSPKMSPAREPKLLPQKSDQVKKPAESYVRKEDKASTQPHIGTVSQGYSAGGQNICPLCKGEMNIDSKQPPNYNTCTECKTTVCNQCGFNPMPMGEVTVKDQLNTTPPVSPKMSPSREAKSPTGPKVEQERKSQQQQQSDGQPIVEPKANDIKPSASQKLEQQSKAESSLQMKTLLPVKAKIDETPSELSKPKAGVQISVKPEQSTCPLCKIKLNVDSKEPPNYNNCTQCKNTVCNQCGFNPMPNKTVVKEWLCLTCQMQRALEETEPPGVASLKPQTPAKPKTGITSPAEPEKNVSSAPQSPQRKLSPNAQGNISETVAKQVLNKQASPVFSKKAPPEQQKVSSPIKSPGQIKQAEHKQSNATVTPQKDLGGFFGLGGGKIHPDVDKPVDSVSGKMLGFGSSIFSSASTLITSAVQDQPKTTPPVSPKLPLAKEVKSLAPKEQKQPEPQQSKSPAVVQDKAEKAQLDVSKAIEASQGAVKLGASCLLCKAELNMGSKDPPNYNTCTECKNTVCNQCGFDPMPNHHTSSFSEDNPCQGYKNTHYTEIRTTPAGQAYSTTFSGQAYYTPSTGHAFITPSKRPPYSTYSTTHVLSTTSANQTNTIISRSKAYSTIYTGQAYYTTSTGKTYSYNFSRQTYTNTSPGQDYSTTSTRHTYSAANSGQAYPTTSPGQAYSTTLPRQVYSTTLSRKTYSSTSPGKVYSTTTTGPTYSSTFSR
ncbi:protein piccolo-like [Fundulus heteroclitus]|uniref:protein piccolo-like n=1 Tax=Fundulus heteroclitus TaxID=8078 RepID=UPI00165B86F4|nr:protein piccolo-like [Fundulus heteroclitus]